MKTAEAVRRACLVVLLGWSLPVFAQMTFRAKPGKSLGDIELGQSRKSVKEQLGPADKSFSTHGKRQAEVWRDTSDGTLMEVLYERGRVSQVKVSAKEYRDAKGIGPGASLEKVQHAYPKLKRTTYMYDDETGKGMDVYDDVERGIAFVFNVPDAAPPKERKVWYVVVHAPKRKAIPTEIKSLANTANY